MSKKRRKEKAAQGKAYAAADDAEQCWCGVCGKPGPTAHSHHFTQKQQKAHANDSRNWLVMGRYCGCHDSWENSKAEFKAAHPDAWAGIVAQMEVVDPQAFELFKLKNEKLFPAPLLRELP